MSSPSDFNITWAEASVETRMGEASEVRFSGSVAGPVDCKHQTYTVKISIGLRFTPNPGAAQVVDLLRRPSSGRGGQDDNADLRCCRNRRTAESRSRLIAISYARRASPCAPVSANNSARAAQ